MLKIFIKTLITFALLSIIFCQYKDIPKERVFNLDKSHDGQEFSVGMDQEFSIKIRGNPTTGYGWYLAEEIQEDESLLSTNLKEDRSSKNYEKDSAPEHMMGVGGNFYFNFKGQRAGTYPLIFVNKRPWETESVNQKAIRVTVNDK